MASALQSSTSESISTPAPSIAMALLPARSMSPAAEETALLFKATATATRGDEAPVTNRGACINDCCPGCKNTSCNVEKVANCGVACCVGGIATYFLGWCGLAMGVGLVSAATMEGVNESNPGGGS